MRAIRPVLAIGVFAAIGFAIWAQNSAQGDEASWPVSEEKSAVTNPILADERSAAQGKVIYARECLSCHGVLGKGDGSAANNLEKKVPDLSDAGMNQYSDGALFYKITVGRRPMPNYKKTLTDEERWHIVNYMRTLTSGSKDSAKK